MLKKLNAAVNGIPRSTLSTVLKSKPALVEKAYERLNSNNKCIWKPTYNKVEKTLHEWFVGVRARYPLVFNLMLQQKAKDFAFILGLEDFTPRMGWLHQFEDCYRIVGKAVAGEGAAVHMDSVNQWVAGKKVAGSQSQV